MSHWWRQSHYHNHWIPHSDFVFVNETQFRPFLLVEGNIGNAKYSIKISIWSRTKTSSTKMFTVVRAYEDMKTMYHMDFQLMSLVQEQWPFQRLLIIIFLVFFLILKKTYSFAAIQFHTKPSGFIRNRSILAKMVGSIQNRSFAIWITGSDRFGARTGRTGRFYRFRSDSGNTTQRTDALILASITSTSTPAFRLFSFLFI